MSKKKIHLVTVRISFDKHVSKAAALRAAKNCIYAELSSTLSEEAEDGWSTAKITSYRNAE